jgi:hypothetical protein
LPADKSPAGTNDKSPAGTNDKSPAATNDKSSAATNDSSTYQPAGLPIILQTIRSLM